MLYDTLRPLVIHLHHLETLSELTGILRSEMIGHHCSNHPPQLEAFEKIASQLLQDVQERLVYRAYIYIRTDILGERREKKELAAVVGFVRCFLSSPKVKRIYAIRLQAVTGFFTSVFLCLLNIVSHARALIGVFV